MGGKTEQGAQPLAINVTVSLPRLLDLVVSTTFPFSGVIHDTGSHHVQVDIVQAASQVCAPLSTAVA